MRKGYLSEYFEGVAVKRISAVEASPERSNQHEFNGISELRKLLGLNRRIFPARFLYLMEDEGGFESAEGSLTWYDARENHPSRSEYRLYFPTTSVSLRLRERDLLVIGKMNDGGLTVIAVEQGSTLERQILWLFGLPDGITQRFTVRELEQDHDVRIGFAARFILEELGIRIKETDGNYLDLLVRKFNGQFPGTAALSEMARETCRDADPGDDPDGTIISWMEQELLLFTTLERHLVSLELRKGFEENIEGFLKFSLSVHNRRKARAGMALENHLEAIFRTHGIRYGRGKITENRTRPDFVFPGIEQYHDPSFNSGLLTMLGSKSSCKDRWRQVLDEAQRIKQKHLFTLEPAISTNQTTQMQAGNLQLVIPQQLHPTFTVDQQNWLMSLRDFIVMVSERQKLADIINLP